MSDIDFDELDKAVSKYVGNTPQQQSASDEAPSDNTQSSVATDTPLLPKRRSSGRFMDVVHPSSDMGGGQPVKREPSSAGDRKVIRPLPSVKPKENDDKKPKDSTPQPVSVDNDWPDPLDMHEQEDSSPQEEKNETPETSTSLFLPDAKVEKRPLGGPALTGPSEDDALRVETLETEKKVDEPDSYEPDLPPELEKDLVAIEAGEASEIVETKNDLAKTDQESTDFKEDTPAEEETTDQPTPPSSGLLASGSIPQQYKKTTPTPDVDVQSEHPAFLNADHYEKTPAVDPQKQKSKAATVFQWIFITLGLLLLGGTLGAAFFIFVNR